MRLVVIIALVLVAAILGSARGAAIPSQMVLYRDPDGWTISYRPELHFEQSSAFSHYPMREVTIATFEPAAGIRTATAGATTAIAGYPPANEAGVFPPDGAAVRISSVFGPPSVGLPAPPETRFPIELADLTAAPRGEPFPALETSVNAFGLAYRLQVWIGPEASALTRGDIANMVRAFGFTSLLPGTTVGSYDVLPLARSYRPRSATRVVVRDQAYYLVHAPGGWYAVGWHGTGLSPAGYEASCRMNFQPGGFLFTCPRLGLIWNRIGGVVRGPSKGPYGDELLLFPARVAPEGHVLLATSDPRLPSDVDRRLYWPAWRPAR
jgi:hypothetical protein